MAVIDFRRRRMVLSWDPAAASWSALDAPPPVVHGIALIRGTPPYVCLYAVGGRLRLQIGTSQYALSEHSPRFRCLPQYWSLGLRRKFVIESTTSGVLYSHAYWSGQGPDFFRWFAGRAEDPDWRAAAARRWTEGIGAETLRCE